AGRHGIPVLEDNAHGLFGKYRGRQLGTFGSMAALSFHETKNFICGEGGALLINDTGLIERAEILREKGTDRSRFFRGQVDKYTWVDAGSSFLPSDLLAAFLLAQLEARETICQKRRCIWERYQKSLESWATQRGIRLPKVPEGCEHTHHLFYLLMPSLEDRAAIIKHLRAHGVQAVFHYIPLHLSPMGLRFGGKAGDCQVTENLSDRLVRLPLFNQLREDDQERVIEAIVCWGHASVAGTKATCEGSPELFARGAAS
ncbi:MAG: DegT/DnrJ/EryC1/StrS family aminotransferase, partial [Verrucomicrobiaceae bacterium]